MTNRNIGNYEPRIILCFNSDDHVIGYWECVEAEKYGVHNGRWKWHGNDIGETNEYYRREKGVERTQEEA